MSGFPQGCWRLLWGSCEKSGRRCGTEWLKSQISQGRGKHYHRVKAACICTVSVREFKGGNMPASQVKECCNRAHVRLRCPRSSLQPIVGAGDPGVGSPIITAQQEAWGISSTRSSSSDRPAARTRSRVCARGLRQLHAAIVAVILLPLPPEPGPSSKPPGVHPCCSCALSCGADTLHVADGNQCNDA